jgi:hypothetical protein
MNSYSTQVAQMRFEYTYEFRQGMWIDSHGFRMMQLNTTEQSVLTLSQGSTCYIKAWVRVGYMLTYSINSFANWIILHMKSRSNG